jgi:putative alpha-1,2-mannosidase
MAYATNYICYRGFTVPARLLMMGILHSDRTEDAYPVGKKGYYMKSMTLLPFAMEIERNITATCVVTGVDNFVGSIDDNMLTFSTRQGPLGTLQAIAVRFSLSYISCRALQNAYI